MNDLSWADAARIVHDRRVRAGTGSYFPDSDDDDPGFWDDVEGLMTGAENVEEALFNASLHPRSATGKWVDGLGLKTLRVGGAVRDALLGREPKDEDYVALHSPEEIKAAVKAAGGRAHDLTVRDRLVGVRAFHPDLPPEGVEIAPPRVERSTGPGRHDFEILPHPEIGTATDAKLLHDDAIRRDLTVNAMYQDHKNDVIDPLGGMHDLEAGTLRTTHADSFRDDPLRILRMARFMSTHGLAPDGETLRQATEHADAVTALTQKGVSGTVATELSKLLMGDEPGRALRLLRDTGVFAHLFPELAPMVRYNQRNAYHNEALDDHAFTTVQGVADRGGSLQARLAALFHDSGKPATASEKPDGTFRFHSHPETGNHWDVSADIARALMNRLNYPKDDIKAVTTLVREHMLPEAEKPTAFKARKLRARLGDELLDQLIIHKQADQESHSVHDQLDSIARLYDLIKDERIAGTPTRLGDLEINGNDLGDLGYKLGPARGAVLRELFHEVLAQPNLNRRDWLLKQAELRRGRLEEAAHDPVELQEAFDINQPRWPKGHARGGQFRPKLDVQDNETNHREVGKWIDKIRAELDDMRNTGPTEVAKPERLQQIGDWIDAAAHLGSTSRAYKRHHNELAMERKEVGRKCRELQMKLLIPSGELADESPERDAAKAQLDVLWDRQEELTGRMVWVAREIARADRDAIVGVLSQIRPMGGTIKTGELKERNTITGITASLPRALVEAHENSMREVQRLLPTAWINDMNEAGVVHWQYEEGRRADHSTAGGTGGMSYDSVIRAKPDEAPRTMLHELLHRVQATAGLDHLVTPEGGRGAHNTVRRRAEIDYLQERTGVTGSVNQHLAKAQRLMDLIPSGGYRPDEMAIPDEFAAAYYGKLYGGSYLGTYNEMLTMAIENAYYGGDAFFASDLVAKDPQTYRWALGMLAAV